MPASAPTPISDEQQRALIAEELDLGDDPQFQSFLQRIWPLYEGWAKIDFHLRWLQVKRHGIQWLMGRAKDKKNWKLGTMTSNDSDVMKNLQSLLKAAQEEIDALVGKAVSRTAKVDGIDAGVLLGGGTLTPPKATNVTAGQAGQSVTNITPPPSPSAPPQSTVPGEALPPLTDYSGAIQEGGFSQELMPAAAARTYLLIRNTGTLPLWWAEGTQATMGAPSERIERGGEVKLTGATAPPYEITLIGAQTGQPFAAWSDV